jgi:hypothetical protein
MLSGAEFRVDQLRRPGHQPAAVLERARPLMPADVPKHMRSKFFLLRALVRMDLHDAKGATGDFQTAFSLWPVRDNPALWPLVDYYLARDDKPELEALRHRVGSLRR